MSARTTRLPWGMMGQISIVDLLHAHYGQWYTARQISKFLKLQASSVHTSLFKLRRWKMVRFKKQTVNGREVFVYASLK